MFTLNHEQIAALESLRPPMKRLRHQGDAAKAERRRVRNGVFDASIRDGLRRSRRVKIFCT